MKALLDTNIIIHRENTRVTNQSIGLLFYWLDKLHYDKMIHPYSIMELKKYKDTQIQSLFEVKLSSYVEMKTVAVQSEEFSRKLSNFSQSENDKTDNQLLYEVYSNRVDVLITEDRDMRFKSTLLGIEDKVFSINSFIEKVSSEYPELVSYKYLSVKKQFMGDIDVTNVFFDSLRDSYYGFDQWFAKKSNEEAYICYSDKGIILGFLYLKIEDKGSDYHDIFPVFSPKKRLKIGTFKIDSTGFRLGERFIKIIFDNAIECNVDEIYVTLFEDRPELIALEGLLKRWGFCEYGLKDTYGKKEKVLIKKMKEYDITRSIKQNFPNVRYSVRKRILPIKPQYHTSLLPDSQLNTENEIDNIEDVSHRYALQKVYVTWGMKDDVQVGDIVLFYRIGEKKQKAYSSVLTTIGVIEDYKKNFSSKKQFMCYCENRSVFTKKELNSFWDNHRQDLCVVRFIYIESLKCKITLKYLWDNNIISFPNGPRPFVCISDTQYYQIIRESKTVVYEVEDSK